VRGDRGPFGFGWSAITRPFVEADQPTPGVELPWQEQHEVSDACKLDHCFAHDIDEPIPVDVTPYRVCGECFHYFPSGWALRRDYLRDALRSSYLKTIPIKEQASYLRHVLTHRAANIRFCPHCLHDW
jgi:hypothetical protein